MSVRLMTCERNPYYENLPCRVKESPPNVRGLKSRASKLAKSVFCDVYEGVGKEPVYFREQLGKHAYGTGNQASGNQPSLGRFHTDSGYTQYERTVQGLRIGSEMCLEPGSQILECPKDIIWLLKSVTEVH